MKQREKFYIFLDIDGVLWDWSWRLNATREGKIFNRLQIEQFNPESVKALNFLTYSLEKKYDCSLVISSSWRINMEKTIKILRKNNINYNGKILATPISKDPRNRGDEIYNIIKKDKVKNFVIIDDESFNFNKYFEQKNIIKTNLTSGSLTMDDVTNWFKRQASRNNFEQNI